MDLDLALVAKQTSYSPPVDQYAALRSLSNGSLIFFLIICCCIDNLQKKIK